MFRNSSFKQKILVLVGTAVIGFVVLSVIAALRSQQLAIDGRRGQLVAAVQSAYNIAAGYQAQAASGALTDADARRAAADAIRVARYGGADGRSDYFYIWTTDGAAVMHPMHPEWSGKPMLGKLLGAKGEDELKRLLDAVAADAGGSAFVPAMFPRPGRTEPVPKLQYGVRLAGWNWVIGSGVYMDDLDAVVDRSDRLAPSPRRRQRGGLRKGGVGWRGGTSGARGPWRGGCRFWRRTTGNGGAANKNPLVGGLCYRKTAAPGKVGQNGFTITRMTIPTISTVGTSLTNRQ